MRYRANAPVADIVCYTWIRVAGLSVETKEISMALRMGTNPSRKDVNKRGIAAYCRDPSIWYAH